MAVNGESLAGFLKDIEVEYKCRRREKEIVGYVNRDTLAANARSGSTDYEQQRLVKCPLAMRTGKQFRYKHGMRLLFRNCFTSHLNACSL